MSPMPQIAKIEDPELQKLRDDLTKITDFIYGLTTPVGRKPAGPAAVACGNILEYLLKLHDKFEARKVPLEYRERHLSPVIYATCEMHGFITRDKSKIANRQMAWIYRDFVQKGLDELREMELTVEGGLSPQ
jgi:hypothetical protein